MFKRVDVEVRIDKTDAIFVDNIHTDVRVAGIGQAVGHVDFFPNNGKKQPGCNSTSKCV